jgi:hypothetical protein
VKTKVQEQIKVQQLLCEANNYKHLIITEVDMRGNAVLLTNKKTLINSIKNGYNKELYIETLKKIKSRDTKPINLSELTALLEIPITDLMPCISALLVEGVIESTINSSILGRKTEVWSCLDDTLKIKN